MNTQDDGSTRLRPVAEVVHLTGELDIARVEEVRQTLLAATAVTVVVDMGEVTFLDSTTLSALIRVQDALDAEGRGLRLIRVGGIARRAIDLTGLGARFGLVD